jgi:hypothetical protein
LSFRGLTASIDDANQLVLKDAQGNDVAQAAPALMWGSALDPATGEPVASEEVAISIVQTPSGPDLEVAPDPEFFSRADVVYPVHIDPSPTLSVNVDTSVRSDRPTASYAEDVNLKSGLSEGPPPGPWCSSPGWTPCSTPTS